jgi:hypothetical protein
MTILAVRTRRTEVIRSVTVASRPFNLAIPLAFAAGSMFGVLAAATGQTGMTSSWMSVAHLVFGFNLVIGSMVFGPWQARVARLGRLHPDGPPTGQLAAVLSDRRIQLLARVDLVSISAVVVLMLVMPFL